MKIGDLMLITEDVNDFAKKDTIWVVTRIEEDWVQGARSTKDGEMKYCYLSPIFAKLFPFNIGDEIRFDKDKAHAVVYKITDIGLFSDAKDNKKANKTLDVYDPLVKEV